MSPRATLLVVEDELHIALGLKENLELEGYAVTLATDGAAGLDALRRVPYDLAILDVMLPVLDGFEICARARREGVSTPLLFLTARGAVDDRIRGLKAGGDDYLAKPFHLEELLTRVEVLLRRRAWTPAAPPPRQEAPLSFGGNTVDLTTGEAHAWDGRVHQLTLREGQLLRVLAEHPGEVLTREALLDAVWGTEVLPATRVLDGLVERLRHLFEPDPHAPRHLHTRRGVGYRFTRDPEA